MPPVRARLSRWPDGNGRPRAGGTVERSCFVVAQGPMNAAREWPKASGRLGSIALGLDRVHRLPRNAEARPRARPCDLSRSARSTRRRFLHCGPPRGRAQFPAPPGWNIAADRSQPARCPARHHDERGPVAVDRRRAEPREQADRANANTRRPAAKPNASASISIPAEQLVGAAQELDIAAASPGMRGPARRPTRQPRHRRPAALLGPQGPPQRRCRPRAKASIQSSTRRWNRASRAV
jgi:hypothetical protein